MWLVDRSDGKNMLFARTLVLYNSAIVEMLTKKKFNFQNSLKKIEVLESCP
jgi:hypothetical protein